MAVKGERVYETYQNVIASRKGHIGIVTLNRPDKFNVLSRAMMSDIGSAVGELNEDDEVRVILINAEGKHFGTGLDLDEFPISGTYEEARAYLEFMHTHCYWALRNSGVPIVTAMQGYALAGGAHVAVACADICVASEDVKIGYVAIDVGFTCVGGYAGLQSLVGVRKAKEMILTSRLIGAEEALSCGLVNKVVPLEKLDEASMEMAEVIASKPPLSVRATKRIFARHDRLTFVDEDIVYGVLGGLLQAQDAKVAMQAFKDKTTPVYSGR